MKRCITHLVLCALVGLATALSGVAEAHTNYDGQLDPNWQPSVDEMGIPGLLTNYIDLGGSGDYKDDDQARAVAIQPDGKVLVAGFSYTHSYNFDHYTCTLMRYNVDGSVDTSFGLNGRAYFDDVVGGNAWNCEFESLAVQDDGKILAAGTVYNETGVGQVSQMGFVIRYLANGTEDTTFGAFGNSYEEGYAGSSFHKVLPFEGGAIAVGSAPNGSDPEFYFMVIGSDGFVSQQAVQNLASIDGQEDAYDALLEPFTVTVSGITFHYTELFLVGTALRDKYSDGNDDDACAIAAFIHYNDNPSDQDFHLDANFNTAGSFGSTPGTLLLRVLVNNNESDTHCYTAIARPGGGDSGVIVGGEDLFKYNSSTNFDASRMVLAEIDGGGDVSEHLPDGTSASYYEDPGASLNSIRDIIALPNGKYAATGLSLVSATDDELPAGYYFGVVRLNADFSRDASFGYFSNGEVSLNLDSYFGDPKAQQAHGVAFDPQRGRLLVAGDILYRACTGFLCGILQAGDHDFEIAAIKSASDRIFGDNFEPGPLLIL